MFKRNLPEANTSTDTAFNNGCMPLMVFIVIAASSGLQLLATGLENKTVNPVDAVALTSSLIGIAYSSKSLISFLRSR